jgi:translation initiation factor IF-3
MARERGLDLVEVAPTANPPVCRVLDYGKFKYEQAKKEREAHKHQKQSQLREVRFKSMIGDHDLDVKIRVISQLLKGGDKVKVSVLFRGRNILHPELGRDLLQRIVARLNEEGLGTLEKHIGMEGRFMTMIVGPGALKAPPRPKVERVTAAKPAEGEPAGDGAMAAAMRAAGAAPAAEGAPATGAADGQ